MSTKYFVKFVPYESDDVTDEYLRNKTIKFSKPYELNDYFELGYIHAGRDHTDEVEKIFKKYLSNSEKKGALLEELPKQIHVKPFVDKLKLDIEHGNPLDNNQKTVILELIGYENVGIACFSDILVLLDNSASIMFAHYGRNLTGLALIYEISETQNIGRDVKYLQSNRRPGSSGSSERLKNWCEGNYEEVSDFVHKSDKWSYEAEHRLFARPKVHIASDHGVKLRSILHTPRLGGNLETGENIRKNLDLINQQYYEGELEIHEIIPSASRYLFKMADNDHKLLGQWVLEKFIKSHSSEEYHFITSLNTEALYQNHLRRFYGYETEKLTKDINLLRKLILNGEPATREFFALTNAKNDSCSFTLKKFSKLNEFGKGELVLMIDDFFINDARKWEIAKKLFEKLMECTYGIPIYLQIAGEDEMTRRFLNALDATKITEIYKFR